MIAFIKTSLIAGLILQSASEDTTQVETSMFDLKKISNL
jgi:hypothetical protein